MDSITKQILQKFSSQKVDLASNIQEFLKYYSGVEEFLKNIDISIKEINQANKFLKADIGYLEEDMQRTNKGIQLAESAAKELGIKPDTIPNYTKAVNAIKAGEKEIIKGKKVLK